MCEICPLFACVYATKSGCSINGWMDKEGELNGKKEYCPIHDLMCITAKCKACGHEGIKECKKVKTEFPILGSKPQEYIPLSVVKPHERQAIINHCQTLEQLARRGGLCWLEMLFVLKDERYNYKIQLSEMSARTKVLQIVDSYFNNTPKE